MKWWKIFNPRYALTPIAVPHIRTSFSFNSYITYKLVYVFGLRVVYWATNDPNN